MKKENGSKVLKMCEKLLIQNKKDQQITNSEGSGSETQTRRIIFICLNGTSIVLRTETGVNVDMTLDWKKERNLRNKQRYTCKLEKTVVKKTSKYEGKKRMHFEHKGQSRYLAGLA